MPLNLVFGKALAAGNKSEDLPHRLFIMLNGFRGRAEEKLRLMPSARRCHTVSSIIPRHEALFYEE